MKNDAALKILGEKSCKIKGGGQELAAMMLMLINFNNACEFFSINIIAAISWPPPLISQLFSPRLFKAAPFFTAWLFLCGFHFFLYFIRPQNHAAYYGCYFYLCPIINDIPINYIKLCTC